MPDAITGFRPIGKALVVTFAVLIAAMSAVLVVASNRAVAADDGTTGQEKRAAEQTSTPTSTPCVAGFGDVQPGDYFYEAVRNLVCGGVISGYSDNTFRPGNEATRAQLAKIVVLANRLPPVTPGTPTFGDVPSDNPFYAYIEGARQAGIIYGYDGPNFCAPYATPCFRPYNSVTRGQLARFIVRARGWRYVTPDEPTFVDVPERNPFYTDVETAFAHGIISGYETATGLEFRWANNATRAQISKIVDLSLRQ